VSELLLGSGYSRDKRMVLSPNDTYEWKDLITLDDNADVNPDILCDLNTWAIRGDNSNGVRALEVRKRHFKPCIKESFFAEVHAYEVLEHLGRQGDITSFFSTFDNIWRILVPGGYLFATCPSRFSNWLWGDPGHCRAILPESLTFLDQTNYEQCGTTMMSDYRHIYQSDFKIISSIDDKTFHKSFCKRSSPRG